MNLFDRFKSIVQLGFSRTKFLFGEIRSGRLVGIHYRGPAGSHIDSIQERLGIVITRTSHVRADDVYQARVSKNGVVKKSPSTMFPDDWTLSRLWSELEHSMISKAAGGGLYKTQGRGPGSAILYGRTTSGIEVRGYVVNHRLDTIFPHW
jgi:hypothetical protein